MSLQDPQEQFEREMEDSTEDEILDDSPVSDSDASENQGSGSFDVPDNEPEGISLPEDEKLLIGTGALQGEVHHLKAALPVFEELAEALCVGAVLPGRHRVAQDDHTEPPGRHTRRELAVAPDPLGVDANGIRRARGRG